MNSDRQYKGNPYQTPVKLRTNAPRQTEEQIRPPRTSQRKQPVVPDDEGDDGWTREKPPTSAVRYDQDYPYLSPRNRTQDVKNPKRTQLVRERRFDKYTLIIVVSLLIIVMAGGWFVFTKIEEAWTSIHDNFVYGTPFRTFQADQYMNMGDTPAHPDHFIALNLHGVIEIIQIDPLDRKKDAVYVLANVGDDSTPASLSFRDTTGSGRTDVIVTIGESAPYTIVLINNGTTLTPTQPAH